MASSSSSSSSSSQFASSSLAQVSQEEFDAFHNIDRLLFITLVFHLGHEPSEAMQVIALWIWLERINRSQCVNILLSYPNPIIEAVFEETVMALRAAETDEFYPLDETPDIPILQNIVGRERAINLRFFHENRIGVLLCVGNIVQQICLRAFQDIIQMIAKYRAMTPPTPGYNYYNYPSYDYQHNNNNNNIISNNNTNNIAIPTTSLMVGDFTVPIKELHYSNVPSSSNNNNNHNINTLTNAQENYLMEIIARMRLHDYNLQRQESEIALPPSERTIFLTFSKGYPISELELREFLYRTFGDVIESLYMQEVGESEQPLYARLVVRDANAMQVILSDHGKAKFSINGKHVWARKYVRKNPNSPPSSPNNNDGNN